MKNLKKLLIACMALTLVTGCTSTQQTSTVETSVIQETSTQEENTKPTIEFSEKTIEANEGTKLSKLDLSSNIKSIKDKDGKDIEKVDKLEDGKSGYVISTDSIKTDDDKKIVKGSYNVEVTAQDSDGNKVSEKFTVKVVEKEENTTTTKKSTTAKKNSTSSKSSTTKKSDTSSKKSSASSSTTKKNSGSSNSNSSNKNNSSSNSSSASKSNNSSSASTNNSSSNTVVCSHNWVALTKTVHHDAVTHTVHHDAEYATGYTTKYVSVACEKCNGCGAEFRLRDYGYDNDTMVLAAIQHELICGHSTSNNCRDEVQEPYQYVSKEAWDETIVDKAAWDETITTGYICSNCGATK